MKIYRLLSPLVISLFFISFNGKAQAFKWLQSPSPDSYNPPVSGLDAAGNLYLAGVFTSTAAFGTTTLTTPHYNAPYLAKYDRKGNVRWAVSLAPNQNFSVLDMAVAPSGDVYLLGTFEDTLDLGGVTLLNPKLASDPYSTSAFIAKVKRKGGGVIWAKTLDGSPSEVAVDGSENAFISGSFIKRMQLESTVLEDTTEWDSYTFLAKYSPGGQLSWAVKSINSTSFNYPQLSVTSSGLATLSWTPGYIFPIRAANSMKSQAATQVTEPYNGGTYTGRFTASGQLAWLKNAQRPVEGYYFQTGMTTDEYGRIYVSGSFAGILVFGNDTLRSAPNPAYIDEYGEEIPESFREEVYAAKLNKRGEVLWVVKTSSSAGANGSAVSLAPDGAIWLAGNFKDTLQLENQTVTTNGSGFFITQLSNEGRVNWINSANGSASYSGINLAADAFGNCFMSGLCTVGATFGDFTTTATNYEHPFLTRVVDQPVAVSRESGSALAASPAGNAGIQVSAFPNPFTDQVALTLTATESTNSLVSVTDLSGRVVTSQSHMLQQGHTQLQLDLSRLPQGAYLVTVTSNGQQAHSRLVKN